MFRKKYTKLVNSDTFEKLKLGLFCLDKEKFKTSAEVVELVKSSIYLVIGTGKGCQVLTEFLHGEKVYLVEGKLGEARDTYNAEGIVTHRGSYCHVTKMKFISSLKMFEGEIMQVPPPYCALKRNGKRISDLVRCGVEVALNPRPVKCLSIQCLSLDFPYFTLRVACGGGFYIRSLVHDLGLKLGSFAHVVELRREEQYPFTLEDCISCNGLNTNNIISAVSRMRKKYAMHLKIQ